MRTRLLVAVAALSILASPAPRAQQTSSFTIAQVLSAPFASELVAAPTGQKVAWVFNERGARNVWVAEGPSFEARAVTRFTGDNGQEMTALEWSPDGSRIVFVRGGAANRAGELPNPTSDPAGVEQAVWVVAAGGGEPRKLAAGAGPAISPKGDLVAFVQRGQIWLAGLDGLPEPSQVAKARGNASSLRWSPDGSQLAFVSGRGTHAFIGVFTVSTRALSFIDPSVDNDTEPTWSPDGRSIALVRRAVDRDQLPFHEEREGEPWTIRVVDVSTGVGREVWKADKGPGSVFQPVTGPSLIWTADNQLVFPWERSGWKNLYAMPAAGGRATLLTPGKFEVEDVILAPDNQTIVFNSNQDDIDRRHVWRVKPGAAPEAVTRQGQGIEWQPAPLPDGRMAFLQSDARRPGRPVLASEARPTVFEGASRIVPVTTFRELGPNPRPSTFPVDALVQPEAVTVTAADGMRIPAQLFLPRSHGANEKHPAVIFFHGGSRRQMLLGWHYRDYYHNAYAFNQYLASRGYVVLSVNYRSGIGYGLNFREALNYGANGASEYNDVVGAGLFLKAHPYVDPARIGLWGGSYGGYLTAMGLARASDMFSVGVDVHGVHDWNVAIRNFAPSFNPEARAEVARRAFLSSPMASIDTWRSPVLVIHGDDDRNVPFSETVDLVEKLRQRNVHVEQLIFPDEVHGFLLHERWIKAYEASAAFLDRYLKPRATTSQQ